MATRRVHFSSPLEIGQVCSATVEYNMSPEKRIGHPDSQVICSTPDRFDRCFAGVDDCIQELSAMFDEDWVKSKRLESPQSQQMDSIMEDDVDELAEDSPSYNLGWVDMNSGSQTAASTSVDDISTRPSYDLGWGANTTTSDIDNDDISKSAEIAEGPAYDLGWGGADTASGSPIDACMELSSGRNDGPMYDLGWGPALPSSAGDAEGTSGDDPIDACMELSGGGIDGPMYDFGWGLALPSSAGDAEGTSGDEVGSDESPVYDLGWVQIQRELFHTKATEELTIGADNLRPDNIIDLCSDEEPVYDLGWENRSKLVIDLSGDADNDLTNGTEAVKLKPKQPIHDDLDMEQDDWESSAVEIIDDDLQGTQTILWVNRRLKTIGNTMANKHIHAIVENATHGLTASHVPADILIDNRSILGGYAGTQDRVTTIGLDICRLHRLIQLQRHAFKSVDRVIESLENV
ncbi:uncharacterized protein F5891DRAFT_987346 [Suillus fuscotomentosus]|uniref:Uncharacterized protein n=1 Tax=Suillus fuscotomentosus TaxID=1912939 RepID=A0AAD4DQ55_9AGAM|nr:uncharacterized protein F5891DRAFT_987346 [Suillus fuscotomentosus]KAG1889620.1 hypothetical protein F5891DRAFT_987346 [Suillus fuscotomentosus]